MSGWSGASEISTTSLVSSGGFFMVLVFTLGWASTVVGTTEVGAAVSWVCRVGACVMCGWWGVVAAVVLGDVREGCASCVADLFSWLITSSCPCSKWV